MALGHAFDRKLAANGRMVEIGTRTATASALCAAAVAVAGAVTAFLLGGIAGVEITFSHLAAAGVLLAASVLYGLLNGSLVGLIQVAVPSPATRWFILFVGYIFVYNWWMVYPLFSQYGAAGPLPTDPLEFSGWLERVWARATPLYAMVPQYHYYMSLTTTYVHNALDRELVGTHLSMLTAYASAAWLLAGWVARRMAHGTLEREGDDRGA